MGGSLGKSESSAQNQSNFNQNVWGPQGDALQGLYGQLGGLFNQTNQGMQDQIPGAVDNMQGIFNTSNPAWQQQLEGGAYQGMDLQGNYNQALQGGGNEQFMNESIMGGAGNNYAQAMQDQLRTQSDQNLGRDLAMNDARAAGYGQGGSSRHGLTEARLYDDAGDRLANQQTNIGFDTFDKDLDRKLGIARNADAFDLARLNSTSGMLNSSNQAMQGGLNYGQNMQNLGMGQFAPQMAPWQAMGQYAANLGRPTVLGSGSGSGSSDSKGFGLSGGMFG